MFNNEIPSALSDRPWALGGALVVLALAGNFLHVSLFFGVHYIFGSVAALLAAVWLGPLAGLATAVVGGLYTLELWGHPWALAIFALEAGVVGLLWQRLKDIVLADLLFWLILGIPLILLTYQGVMGMGWDSTGLIAFKQPVNGVFNALVASLVLHLVGRGQVTVPLRQLIFKALFAGIFLVGIVLITAYTHNLRAIQEELIGDILREHRQVIAGQLQTTLAQANDPETADYPSLGKQTGLGLILDDGRFIPRKGLPEWMPAGEQRALGQGLTVWLPPPERDLPAMERWQAGHYAVEVPLPEVAGVKRAVLTHSATPVVARLARANRVAHGLLGLLALVGSLASLALATVLARPFRHLAEAVRDLPDRIEAGQEAALPITRVREPNQLGEAFGDMAGRLGRSFRDLEAQRAILEERENNLYRLTEILDATPDYVALADADGQVCFLNNGGRQLLGWPERSIADADFDLAPIPAEAFPGTWAHPEWAYRLVRDQGIPAAVAHGQWEGETALIDSEGREIPVSQLILAHYDHQGTFLYLSTIMRDIRHRKELEEEQRLLATTFRANQATMITDAEGTIHRVNPAFEAITGYSAEEVIGANPRILSSGIHDRPFYQQMWRELKENDHWVGEIWNRRKNGTVFPVWEAISAIRDEAGRLDHYVSLFQDITDRKAAEEASERANRALRAILRANAALVHAEDEATLFQEVCHALTQSHGYPLAWVGLAADDAERRVPVAGAAGEAQEYLAGLEVRWDDSAAGQGPTGRAIRTGEPQVLRPIEEQSDHAPWREAARTQGFRASVALPVAVAGETLGALNVYATDPDAFDDEEMGLLQELAGNLGFGIWTLRVRAERDRQLEELRLAGAVFDNTPEGILVTDPQTRIQTVNRAFTEITGYTGEEVIGRTPELLQSGLQDEAFYRDLWTAVQQQGHWQGEIWNRRKDGSLYPEWLTLSEVRDTAGALTHYVGIFADISQAHQTQEELTFRTYHDPLTGLPNRALFRERLGHALDSGHQGLALALIDLREFRALNDSFGTEGGDAILRQTAHRVVAALPERDTVARPGGDEFWVLMEELPHQEAVEQRLTALHAALSEPMTVTDHTVRLEANMGVALAPEDGTEVDGLLTGAATALHQAQAERGNRIQYFRPEMHATVQHRVRLAEALKGALEQDELRVWYQPQVDLASGATVGLEALVRWQHPAWGMVSPGEFIPVAEGTGQVVAIGDWVLEQALAQFVAWRQSGYAVAGVAVNAATAQLQEPDWVERVAAMLERTGAPAEYLEIEITEEGVLSRLDEAVATMNRLKDRGIRLAIDDFGTGYSSLAYLKRLPVDTLKIDKSFVDGLPDVEHDRSIAEAILAVAGALDLRVVAEGVETEEQARWLREHGVRWAQGFLYHRPQAAEQITGILPGSH